MKCCCRHRDARDCFLARHPECRRTTDVGGPFDLYESAIDEVCDCSCHHDDDLDSVQAEVDEEFGDMF